MARPSLLTPLVCAVVSLGLAIGSSAEAQRKKKPTAPPKKKPAATAPAKPTPPTTPEPTDQTAADEAAESADAPKKKSGDEELSASVDSEKSKKAFEEESPSKPSHTLPMIDASIGLRGFQRHLNYNDDVSGMPTYNLSAAPSIAAAVEFYPMASSGGFAGNLGLTGGFDYGFALGSTYDAKPPPGEEGKTFATKSYGYSIGAKMRFPVGAAELGLGLEYGGQAYLVSLAPPVQGAPGVPDVSYSFVRPNFTGRIPLGEKLALRLGVGYLAVLSAGEIRTTDATYFYSGTTKVAAVDGRLGAAMSVGTDLEARLEFDFRRYFYAMDPHPEQGDPFIVGGALDQYFGLTLALAYRH
jgi:hypothetical protein